MSFESRVESFVNICEIAAKKLIARGKQAASKVLSAFTQEQEIGEIDTTTWSCEEEAQKWFDHIAVAEEDKSKISFPKVRDGVVADRPKESKSRQMARASVFFGKTIVNNGILGAMGVEGVEASEIESLATAYGEAVEEYFALQDFSFKVCYGENLIDAYETAQSCMQGSDEVKLYAENPDKVGIVAIYKSGDQVGRALLWHTDEGVTFVDRVYPNDSASVPALHSWAFEQGWWVRESQSACGNTNYSCNDKKATLLKQVNGVVIQDNYTSLSAELDDNDHYPYGDTMAYCVAIEGFRIRLTNDGDCKRQAENHWIVLHSTSGYDGVFRKSCENCRKSVWVKDAKGANGDYYCGDCHDLLEFYKGRYYMADSFEAALTLEHGVVVERSIPRYLTVRSEFHGCLVDRDCATMFFTFAPSDPNDYTPYIRKMDYVLEGQVALVEDFSGRLILLERARRIPDGAEEGGYADLGLFVPTNFSGRVFYKNIVHTHLWKASILRHGERASYDPRDGRGIGGDWCMEQQHEQHG